VWAVLYDDGTSLTTASERIARSLAEAEHQRGRRVTVRCLDDVKTHPRGTEEPARSPGRACGDGPVVPSDTDKSSVPGPSRPAGGADSVPEPELIRPAERFAGPKPISEPEPALVPELAEVLGPTQAVEPTQAANPAPVPEPASEASSPELTCEPEPARTATSTRRRRLLLYALAAASIVVAAALVDHWGVLPRVGANTGSSTTQVGAPPHRSQLLPPLGQPPVMHFSNAADATSAPAESSAQPASPAAEPSGVQNQEARPTRSTASAKQPAARDG